MTDTAQITLSAISVLVALATLVYAATRAGHGDTLKLEHRLTALETKVDVFWSRLAVDAAAILHSPDPRHARTDLLLEKLIDDRLTDRELAELATHLRHAVSDKTRLPGERLSAATILRALEARYEGRL